MKYLELLNKINQLDEEKRRLVNHLHSHVGYSFIKAVDDYLELHMLEQISESALLVDELIQRDEPMSYETIKSIFEFSGFKYDESHIEASKPDSREVIAEQARYYRE